MKKFFAKIIEAKLKYLALLVVKKYQPEVIGITGSVGKTTTKEAVYTVLRAKYNVRRSRKNYNNEIGLPLTILGEPSAGSSLFGWLGIFWRGLKLILKTDKNYPKILVLEMGADKPGDIAYLLKIVKPKVGVLTKIARSHLEAFKNIAAIEKEKGLLVTALDKDGTAVLNVDDKRVAALAQKTKAKVITYGLENKQADVFGEEFSLSLEDKDGFSQGDAPWVKGLNFKLRYNGSVVPVFLAEVLGYNAVYAALAAAAVGINYGFNLVEISNALQFFKPPRGRMNPIAGIKHTLLIDDTYNASPQSSKLALRLLAKIPIGQNSRRIAVFGNMLELGRFTEEGHRQVGEAAAELGIDIIVTVGELARNIAHGAVEAGMNEDKVFKFGDNKTAGRFLQDLIKRGDIILIKGSQGARMEQIIKELMADPLKASSLLVRQSKEWLG